MSEQEQAVLEGYRQDARGRLVPVETIQPIDLLRDQTVISMVMRAKDINAQLAFAKGELSVELDTFLSISAEQYGVKLGGNKGNVTLYSFDGRYKIIMASPDVLVFDERLQSAKVLIDECLREWTDGARVELRALIDQAFQVDQQGKISVQRVLGLRKLKIEHETWARAMAAINDAITVVGRKNYIRVYEREGNTERYKQIVLDIAGV